MAQNSENTNAFLIHISAFGGFLFPFGSIITPLVAWQTLKNRSKFLDEQGKEAVNFNISYSLYMLIASVIVIPFFLGSLFRNRNYHNHWDIDVFDWGWDVHFGSFFGMLGFGSLIGIIGLIKLALIIIAALKANKGENYRYPLTIKFVK
jgi:uncharacterized Tic20 family protein